MRCFGSGCALLMFVQTVTRRSSFFCSHRTKHNALCIPQAQSSSTFLRQLDAMIHPFLSCCSFVLVRPLSISFYSPGHMTHPDSEYHQSPLTYGFSHVPVPAQLLLGIWWETLRLVLALLHMKRALSVHSLMQQEEWICSLSHLLKQKTLPKQANIPQPSLISAKLWPIL